MSNQEILAKLKELQAVWEECGDDSAWSMLDELIDEIGSEVLIEGITG